jgi:hypothetical protein
MAVVVVAAVLIIVWRMLADQPQQPAQVHQFRPVQRKCLDRGSPNGCPAEDHQRIGTPFEVPRPALAARIVQRYTAASERITCVGSLALVAIAAAGQGQIAHRGESAFAARNDVIDLEWLRGIRRRRAAVLATPPRALGHRWRNRRGIRSEDTVIATEAQFIHECLDVDAASPRELAQGG